MFRPKNNHCSELHYKTQLQVRRKKPDGLGDQIVSGLWDSGGIPAERGQNDLRISLRRKFRQNSGWT